MTAKLREYPYEVQFHQHWQIIDTRTGEPVRDFGNHTSAAMTCLRMNDEHNQQETK